uniref:Uroporphyrinogen decarboxylase n=1 Tax=Nylanderia nr. pubens LZ-2010 TaxID=748169 RepID=D5LXI4_9HYME|nr:uroporphyrinogen decarboxylase [Nylanderia nr. pubens LZ-2010]
MYIFFFLLSRDKALYINCAAVLLFLIL